MWNLFVDSFVYNILECIKIDNLSVFTNLIKSDEPYITARGSKFLFSKYFKEYVNLSKHKLYIDFKNLNSKCNSSKLRQLIWFESREKYET